MVSRWTIRLRLESGNIDGWKDVDFPFAMRGEAEAFLRAALLAENVIQGERRWVSSVPIENTAEGKDNG